MRAAHDVLVNPADARRVRTQARDNARRKPSRRGAKIFEHTRARPVEVGAILEDDVDERDAEEREAAHDTGLGNAQHCRGQRISDLILDHLRRLAGIFRVDNHLNVGEVGNRVERHARHRVDSGQGDEYGRKADQENVAGGPTDEHRNHFTAPGCVKACSAALRLLSASIRNVAAVTTSSPLLTPSRTST